MTHQPTELPWMDPLAAVARYTRPQDAFVLLHSSYTQHSLGQRSILAMLPNRTHMPTHFDALGEAWWAARTDNFTPYALLGWMGYEASPMHAALGNQPPMPPHCHLPPSWWMQPQSVLVFDHTQQRLECYGILPAPLATSPWPTSPSVRLATIGTSSSKADYLRDVSRIQQAIMAGDYYQANLTRKFFGTLTEEPCPLALFAEQCRISPAPFTALVHTPDWSILSASMEEFLSITHEGHVRASPIKGSAPRHATPDVDARIAAALTLSEKDNAENTMIVDLTRHDLAQHCAAGSVRVSKLCGLESFAQLHHLVSHIEGSLAPESTPLTLLRDAFPPASMTGAPKRAVVHALTMLEPMPRGVYSGCIGWLGHAANLHSSVVIRTVVLQHTRFEFQVGGGIVSDSTPLGEWRETMTKARGMATLLGIPMELLEDL
jgi:anthranilate/para-aminobenzoate synthase component I